MRDADGVTGGTGSGSDPQDAGGCGYVLLTDPDKVSVTMGRPRARGAALLLLEVERGGRRSPTLSCASIVASIMLQLSEPRTNLER